MRLLYLLSTVLLLRFADCSLDTYGEKFIFKSFINNSLSLDLEDQCKDSLNKVFEYLTQHDTLDLQRKYFSASFATGPANLFLSRDQDRWVYRGYECLLAAGETVYSKSEHPLHYCYAYRDDDLDATGYSVCIPSPCANDNLKLIQKWQQITRPNETVMELESSCTKSRHDKQWFEKPIPLMDLAFNLLLVLLIALATGYHSVRGDGSKNLCARLLLSFSFKKNIKKLVEMPKDPQATITCMFGLRFLSMVWTLVGHSFIFVQAYMDNVDDYKDDIVDNFWNQWISNFTLSVDVFLVLGGTVLSYSWFRKWLKNTTEPEPSWTSWGYWLRFYRHRIVRLWPAYLYTVMAVTLRISVTHFHPMWPPTDPAVQCPLHWYENVLFVNSLTSNRCMPWTWYIGTEFIYYVISPIFLLSLRKQPKIGLVICAVTIATSAGLNVVSIVENNFPPTQLLWKQPEIFNMNFIEHHVKLYIKPQFRIGPYIIGILLGYYLACYQKLAQKTDREFKSIAIGWACGCLAMFWGLFGLYPALQGWNWPLYHLVYGAIHRDVFAFGIAWLIYACHTGIGGFVNKLLSASPLLPLSNLCYSVYLFHMIPVVLTYMLVPFPIVFKSKWVIAAHCVVQLLISYFFAMICTLSVEYPVLNMERIFLAPRQSSKTTLKPIQTAESEIQLKSPSA